MELYHTAYLPQAYCACITRWGWVVRKSREAKETDSRKDLPEPGGWANRDSVIGWTFPEKRSWYPEARTPSDYRIMGGQALRARSS